MLKTVIHATTSRVRKLVQTRWSISLNTIGDKNTMDSLQWASKSFKVLFFPPPHTTCLLLLISGYHNAPAPPHTHTYTHKQQQDTHTQATQKLWIGCNNWSRWQGRNIIHSHGVSCHRWQADINIPQPLCQGLMAVHHATVTHRKGVHTHTHTQTVLALLPE